MKSVELLLADENETDRLGKIIASQSRAGDVIYLDGELGTGKTTLTKSIAGSLGVPVSQVTSPTFTLIHEYRAGTLPIYHFDLYRLTNPQDLDQLGFDDYLAAQDGILIIEWASKASDRLIDDGLNLNLSLHADSAKSRNVRLTASEARSVYFLEAIVKDFDC
jgi:tRNA threonylcarbamoyladenosine biosynthesis protein TsaE